MLMLNEKDFRIATRVGQADAPITGLGALAPAGALAGSLVETPAGVRRIESLRRGDLVATYDGGFRPVLELERRRAACLPVTEAIVIPGGALGNCSALSLLPAQPVFVASPVVEDVLDRDGVLIAAADLVGHCGILRAPLTARAEIVTLHFAEDEQVYLNSGLLLHCAAGTVLGAAVQGGCGTGAHHLTLDGARAAALLTLMRDGARFSDEAALAA